MKKMIESEKLPIKLWLDDIEEGALTQAKNLANLPFAFKHIALMPDAHEGFGMPIGGVLATKDVIIPNAVGVDIGCGMCAVRTSLTEIKDQQRLKEIMSRIRENVPLGFNHHKRKQGTGYLPTVDAMPADGVVLKEYESALKQVGTLGGGNHFIEIQHGSDGFVWLMIHSGSRNIGKQVADYYNKMAIQLNEQWQSSVPRKWDLAYLPTETQQAHDYLIEMQYCVDFALANRKLMMDRIIGIFYEFFPSNFTTGEMINIAHNYAIAETHFGEQVWVHRKGATQAGLGQTGIIPGSQGTASYIVVGKGNAQSFESCSHGAGRKLGRREAVRSLDLQQEIDSLNKKNILHSIRSKNDLEEAPSAYKDINEVMRNQSDLVDILTELKPLAVIKG